MNREEYHHSIHAIRDVVELAQNSNNRPLLDTALGRGIFVCDTSTACPGCSCLATLRTDLNRIALELLHKGLPASLTSYVFVPPPRIQEPPPPTSEDVARNLYLSLQSAHRAQTALEHSDNLPEPFTISVPFRVNLKIMASEIVEILAPRNGGSPVKEEIAAHLLTFLSNG